MKHQQPTLWETLFAEEVADLCEPWMRAVDELLEGDELVNGIYDAQGQRTGMIATLIRVRATIAHRAARVRTGPDGSAATKVAGSNAS